MFLAFLLILLKLIDYYVINRFFSYFWWKTCILNICEKFNKEDSTLLKLLACLKKFGLGLCTWLIFKDFLKYPKIILKGVKNFYVLYKNTCLSIKMFFFIIFNFLKFTRRVIWLFLYIILFRFLFLYIKKINKFVTLKWTNFKKICSFYYNFIRVVSFVNFFLNLFTYCFRKIYFKFLSFLKVPSFDLFLKSKFYYLMLAIVLYLRYWAQGSNSAYKHIRYFYVFCTAIEYCFVSIFLLFWDYFLFPLILLLAYPLINKISFVIYKILCTFYSIQYSCFYCNTFIKYEIIYYFYLIWIQIYNFFTKFVFIFLKPTYKLVLNKIYAYLSYICYILFLLWLEPFFTEVWTQIFYLCGLLYVYFIKFFLWCKLNPYQFLKYGILDLWIFHVDIFNIYYGHISEWFKRTEFFKVHHSSAFCAFYLFIIFGFLAFFALICTLITTFFSIFFYDTYYVSKFLANMFTNKVITLYYASLTRIAVWGTLLRSQLETRNPALLTEFDLLHNYLQFKLTAMVRYSHNLRRTWASFYWTKKHGFYRYFSPTVKLSQFTTYIKKKYLDFLVYFSWIPASSNLNFISFSDLKETVLSPFTYVYYKLDDRYQFIKGRERAPTPHNAAAEALLYTMLADDTCREVIVTDEGVSDTFNAPWEFYSDWYRSELHNDWVAFTNFYKAQQEIEIFSDLNCRRVIPWYWNDTRNAKFLEYSKKYNPEFFTDSFIDDYTVNYRKFDDMIERNHKHELVPLVSPSGYPLRAHARAQRYATREYAFRKKLGVPDCASIEKETFFFEALDKDQKHFFDLYFIATGNAYQLFTVSDIPVDKYPTLRKPTPTIYESTTNYSPVITENKIFSVNPTYNGEIGLYWFDHYLRITKGRTAFLTKEDPEMPFIFKFVRIHSMDSRAEGYDTELSSFFPKNPTPEQYEFEIKAMSAFHLWYRDYCTFGYVVDPEPEDEYDLVGCYPELDEIDHPDVRRLPKPGHNSISYCRPGFEPHFVNYLRILKDVKKKYPTMDQPPIELEYCNEFVTGYFPGEEGYLDGTAPDEELIKYAEDFVFESKRLLR